MMHFLSPQSDGTARQILVNIESHPDPLLPQVSNLAIGPPTDKAEIDDQIKLKHQDRVKVYSTLVFCMILFLKEYPDLTIGLDGSDDFRAAIYHGIFLNNRHYLGEYFVPLGVDWYVKLLRNREDIERKSDGEPLFKPITELFDYCRSRHDLYRYYLVRLNQ